MDLVGYGSEEARQSGENTVQGTASGVMSSGSLDDQLIFRYDTGDMLTPGDSGGGMFIQDEKPSLAGIHSAILSTDEAEATDDIGISTRISSYSGWIDQVTGLDQDPKVYSSPPPSVDSVPLQVDEGQGVWFLVQLGAPAEETARVAFHTRDGSARAGLDYIPTQGTLTLEPGEQWAKIWVQTLADDLLEGEESFSLVLTDPQSASFPEQAQELTAERTINDDLLLTGVTELEPELYQV